MCVPTILRSVVTSAKPSWLTQRKPLAHQERAKCEPGTHWAFSHQPMIPCTPPEFLKMIPAPPAQHACIVHLCQKGYSMAQACQTWWEPIARSCRYAISITSLHVLQMTERKTPLCCLYAPELSCEIKPEAVVEMVVLDNIWGCDHTYNLFNLVQIMQHQDEIHCFVSHSNPASINPSACGHSRLVTSGSANGTNRRFADPAGSRAFRNQTPGAGNCAWLNLSCYSG